MLETEDVLFTDLRASKKSFDRILAVGLLLAAIGHFYVVEPYFHYKARERQVQEKIEAKKALQQQLGEHLDKIQRSKKGVDRTLTGVRRQIDGFPDHLRSTIPKIGQVVRSASASMAAQSGVPARQIDGFSVPSTITSLEKAVPWYINEWFGRLLTTLRDGVVTPLQKLEALELTSTELDIEATSKHAVEKVRTYVEGVDPGFWRSYEGGKVPVAQGLNEVVSTSFDPIQKEVSELLRAVGANARQQEEELQATMKALEETKNLQKSLAELVTSLESPFGRIPVGLTAIIKLFPLLVAGLVVVATATLRRSTRLYVGLWDEMKKRRPDLDVKAFQRLADCWYLPPNRRYAAGLALILFYLITLAVFARAASLVLGEPGLFAQELVGGGPGRELYITGYLAGLLAIPACTYLAWNDMRSEAMKAVAA